jgi:hypothetical protein
MSEIDVAQLNKEKRREKEGKKRETSIRRRTFVTLGTHHRNRKKAHACETL